ncbi:S8 family serine peptidase [Tenacibaculum sp. MEBiC06402]|uniref:S8 family serine peptidase n=1 Tax=unclassified Tenacibaculum TaxID=2635139 RepID=UPI003B9A6E83
MIKRDFIVVNESQLKAKKNNLSEDEKKSWFLMDIIKDSIPGLSIERVHDSIDFSKTNKKVLIAILDSEVDINHEYLKNNIWGNKNEIAENNLDDDKNGYVDDVNGWNFLGSNDGENNSFTSYSFTRVIKKFENRFNDTTSLNFKDSVEYRMFIKAKERFDKKGEFAKEDIEYSNMLVTTLNRVDSVLNTYFLNQKYSQESLDSLKEKYSQDENLQECILIKSNFIKYGFSREYVDNYRTQAQERVSKLLNLNYDDRALIGDNPDDVNDIYYGNNLVDNNINLFTHGTKIAGSIISINENVEIMPVCISPFGDERDKDIAVGIKYAVDNGAKIINMSFGKEFSLNNQWVLGAMKYAEQKNVLIVSSAGNSGYDLNKVNSYYPNDNIDNGEEVVDNFILVGGISRKLDDNLLYYDSNYGNIDVDFFAPAEDIYTTFPNSKKGFDSGTSLASALTCGVASLIYQKYPNLKPSEVKSILMSSGITLNIEVKTPVKGDKKRKTPLSKLSKSGKILNAYNALIMAENIYGR